MREREVIRDRPAEREIIYEDRPAARGGGGPMAAIVGILLVLLIGWILFNAFGGAGDTDAGSDAGIEAEIDTTTDG